MIEQERKKEDERESELKQCKDDGQRTKLESMYGYQRAEAQQKITHIMTRHRDELNRLS
jgi:hypothetical protein